MLREKRVAEEEFARIDQETIQPVGGYLMTCILGVIGGIAFIIAIALLSPARADQPMIRIDSGSIR